MTQKRIDEIYAEMERRLNLWLQHSTFDDMTCEGSLMWFDMNLAMIGYPFADKPKWMHKKGFVAFCTPDEANHPIYDQLVEKLFAHAEELTNGNYFE